MPARFSSKKIRMRNRNNKQFIQGAFALFVMVCLMLLFIQSRVTSQVPQSKTSIVAEFDTVDLPVPTRFVPVGTAVQDISIEMLAFPEHQVPKGALRSVEQIKNAVARAPLPAHLPLFLENFSLRVSSVNAVVEQIPDGMRAITVQVDATSSVEGWASSGSLVDVLLIEDSKTVVIAEKVKILSVERSVEPVEAEKSPEIPSTATLLVTQNQALAITTAIPRGRVAFALRSFKDEASWIDKSFTADRLNGSNTFTGKQSDIKGYVSVDGEKGSRKFALADGKWIKTEVVPEGFFGKDG